MHLFLHGCPEILRLIPTNQIQPNQHLSFSSCLIWRSIGSFGLKTETTCAWNPAQHLVRHIVTCRHVSPSLPPALKGCLSCTRFGSPISAEICRKTSATPRQTLGRTSELWNSTDLSTGDQWWHHDVGALSKPKAHVATRVQLHAQAKEMDHYRHARTAAPEN